MNAGRNDPCPCGSGRKHKHCCGKAAPGSPLEIGTAGLAPRMRAAAGDAPVWQAEAVPVQMGFDDDAAARPVVLMVTAAGFLLHADIRRRLSGDGAAIAAVLEAALSICAREVGRWPAGLHVRHEEVATALAPMLRPRDVEVLRVDALPDVEEAARSMMDRFAGLSSWPPVCRPALWSAWGLPRDLVAETFAVAAAFFRAAPWRALANLQAPRLTTPAGREWTVCVLGNAGEEFGVALYSDADDLFERLAAADEGEEAPFERLRGRMIALSFTPLADLTREARRELRAERWELANDDAVPGLMTVNMPGGGVTSADVADLLVALRAILPFAETHRLALLREERTGEPCEPIDWEDPGTGARLRYAGEGAQAGGDLEGVPDQIAELISQVIHEVGEGADPDEVMSIVRRRAADLTGRWDASPQPDLGGLTPNQVQRLLDQEDWLDGNGPVRLNGNLAMEDLRGSDRLHNVRTLLAHARESGGLPATQAANLKLAVVADLLDRLRFPEGKEEALRYVSKRITEYDVGELHEARVLAEIAGLLHFDRGRFRLTPDGEALLDEARAGELQTVLVDACFLDFELAYPADDDWPELQTQAGYTLVRLREAARDWRTAEALLPDVVLSFATSRAPMDDYVDVPALLLRIRILERLVAFGLLQADGERDGRPGAPPRRFRVTSLYDALVEFDPGRSG